ncbi:MAG: DNA gyrase subunit A [Dehalococcoidia bacterium]|nr:DNA gyrase subunit A [Dehalococcoidia bacterium]
MTQESNKRRVNIETELRTSYLDYAMSVIVSRALPDVRDGLKPVHRRILYAMNDMGIRHNTAHKKSARIVGEVLGKYHPHGDAPVYEAMVRMAQDFSLRYMLVDGQGNFGSVDNDPPAAMRYTEARLSEIASEVLADIDKDTVDFVPNFDESLKEPRVLPSRLPNLLLNGASGIAVGMATNMPPHNLVEICDAIAHLIEHPDATADDLMRVIPGPDFPTGGIILGIEGIRNMYTLGQGRILVQAKTDIEDAGKGRSTIVITELPYQVNKAALVEKIVELVRNKNVEGISEVRDESDRHGMRVVVELKREAQPQIVLQNLYKHTSMRTAFHANMLALVDGQPLTLSLRKLLECHIDFRQTVITRRSKFDLNKARERAHILEGLRIALDNLDKAIKIIRGSGTPEEARAGLVSELKVSEVQAQAILDMQLRRLASLERQKINDEYAVLLKTISYLEDLLANPRKVLFLVKEEVTDLKKKYGDARRTEIRPQEAEDFCAEDLIPHQDVVLTLSYRGYLKRLPCDAYRLQRRGGRGATGMVTREADAVHILQVADTHSKLLFFTNRGRVFSLRCYELPQDVTKTAKGTPLISLLPMDPKERVTAMLAVDAFTDDRFLIMATANGEVKKTALSNFAYVRSSGIIATGLEKGDELVATAQVVEGQDVILVSQRGQAVRFCADILRLASRTSGGVRGMRLSAGDTLVSMDVVVEDSYLLTATANGFGKLTKVASFPCHSRGTVGVRAHLVTPKTGEVTAARVVNPEHELMIMSAAGVVIRTSVEGIRIVGRSSQGVSLMKPDAEDKVISITVFEPNGSPVGDDKQPCPPPALKEK